MKVRAVTVGAPLGTQPEGAILARAGALARRLRDDLAAGGLELQTVRLTTPPVSRLLAGRPAGLGALARALAGPAQQEGFDYVGLGAIDTLASPAEVWRPLLEAIPEVMGTTETVFGAASVATRGAGINLAATRICGEVVARIAGQTADGFGNLRFAALANCPPHIPFFPAAYHDGGQRLTASLALEGADLAVAAFAGASDLVEAESRLVAALTAALAPLHAILDALQADHPGLLTGVDLSLAPFPADDRSVGAAVERLGLPTFGGPGTLFLSALLTRCLRRVAETLPTGPHGFSGLMLPVLEDAVLAARAGTSLGLDGLLLYSAVCGLGLDTVPLPGDTPAGVLAAIILDVATLAVRLDKPLTARLFPVPGKRAGDPVRWEFPYFAPSRALTVQGQPLGGAIVATDRYNPAWPMAGTSG